MKEDVEEEEEEEEGGMNLVVEMTGDVHWFRCCRVEEGGVRLLWDEPF